jgi:redox-sensing transcriptional repressor
MAARARCRTLGRMSSRSRVPRPAARRLSLYLRELKLRARDGSATISSRQLGEALGLTDAQVRKDLAHFGHFGQPGVGYRCVDLLERLRMIMGIDRAWPCVLVGAGNIGRALLSYRRFEEDGFEIKAVFDRSREIVGTSIAGHKVRPIDDLVRGVGALKADIGIVAVPADAAPAVAAMLIEARIRGILNFTPCRLDVPASICVRNVDFSVALEQLAFDVSLAAAQDDES